MHSKHNFMKTQFLCFWTSPSTSFIYSLLTRGPLPPSDLLLLAVVRIAGHFTLPVGTVSSRRISPPSCKSLLARGWLLPSDLSLLAVVLIAGHFALSTVSSRRISPLSCDSVTPSLRLVTSIQDCFVYWRLRFCLTNCPGSLATVICIRIHSCFGKANSVEKSARHFGLNLGSLSNKYLRPVPTI